MLSIAVPKSLKPLLVSHLPEALIIGCEETDTGAIAQLPDLSKYDIIACGPGLTMDGEGIMATVLKAECPLVLDADGLNIIAQIKYNLLNRPSATVITPHLGEFKRLFPHIQTNNRIAATQQAAKESGAIVLLKGAKTAIASPQGAVWLIGESTPALARGGSGDVLTGLIGGLMAQPGDIQTMVALGAWCHAQGGILADSERTQMGVDAYTLAQYIIPAIAKGKGERGKGKGEREKGKG